MCKREINFDAAEMMARQLCVFEMCDNPVEVGSDRCWDCQEAECDGVKGICVDCGAEWDNELQFGCDCPQTAIVEDEDYLVVMSEAEEDSRFQDTARKQGVHPC